MTRLWGIGVQASLRDVVTVGGAAQHLLAETRSGRTAFVIGTPALKKHVADAGLRLLNGTDLASRAEVVVIAGTEDFVYDDLRNASLAVRRGADFIATGRDPTYPQPDGMWPGTGALLAAVEVASESKAEIVGKPNPQLLLTALDRLGEGRTLVVGDRVDSDLAAAADAELDAALVMTGGQTDERRGRRGSAAGGRGRDARRAHPALSSRSSSGGRRPRARTPRARSRGPPRPPPPAPPRDPAPRDSCR